MIFSKTTSYGIRALGYLAGQPADRLCGLQEIAEREQIPPVYLRKILGELRRHRLLLSHKGIHGGSRLARPPEEIRLWEVFRVLEPDPYLDMCILGRGVCRAEDACALHEDWRALRKEIIRLMKDKTIAQVATAERVCQPQPTPEEGRPPEKVTPGRVGTTS